MDGTLHRFARVALPPPRYLWPLSAGIDVSTSGVKLAVAKEHAHGLELAVADERRFAPGAFERGEIVDRTAVVKALRELSRAHGVREAHVSLPEARAYLFETIAEGSTAEALRASVERRIDEFVPIPPAEVAFDIVPLRQEPAGTRVVGVGYARRAIDEFLAAFADAGIGVRSLEDETFSVPRALSVPGEAETALLIDIGRSTTKLIVATGRVPRDATTLDIGGHALTLAVQKHFGVTEEEAKKVKAEQGIVAGEGNDEYVAAMLSTAAAIRDEILRRLDYWQTHAAPEDRATRAILVGGNASIRGLDAYLAGALGMPVADGDVFRNFASTDHWLPPVERRQSLAYATAIGLTLRDTAS
jgi:type IV pilus assembly protein PilM